MPIIQEAFDIPEDIAFGLATGLYRRIGGVVRYATGPNKGQIVKHLKSITLEIPEEAQSLAVKAVEFAKNNKITLTVAGICGVIAVVGTGIYLKAKNTEPIELEEFKVAFKNYLEAIRSGNLNEELIDIMNLALEGLKTHKDYKKFQIQLSAEDLNTIVCKVYEYTKKLAVDNNIEFDSMNQFKDSTDTIIALEQYLNIQKNIFSSVA